MYVEANYFRVRSNVKEPLDSQITHSHAEVPVISVGKGVSFPV